MNRRKGRHRSKQAFLTRETEPLKPASESRRPAARAPSLQQPARELVLTHVGRGRGTCSELYATARVPWLVTECSEGTPAVSAALHGGIRGRPVLSSPFKRSPARHAVTTAREKGKSVLEPNAG